MGGKREKPEDIVLKLRQVEVLQGQGKPLADAGWHNFLLTRQLLGIIP